MAWEGRDNKGACVRMAPRELLLCSAPNLHNEFRISCFLSQCLPLAALQTGWSRWVVPFPFQAKAKLVFPVPPLSVYIVPAISLLFA